MQMMATGWPSFVDGNAIGGSSTLICKAGHSNIMRPVELVETMVGTR